MNKIGIIFCIVIIIIVIIMIWFFIKFVCFRAHALDYLENIKEMKSKIQIIKTKGNQVIKKMSEVVDMNTSSADKLASHNQILKQINFNGRPGGINLDINNLDENSNNLGASIARELSAARLELNSLIKKYNLYIKQFFNLPFSAILKYKEIDYIDETNLDESIKLENKEW